MMRPELKTRYMNSAGKAFEMKILSTSKKYACINEGGRGTYLDLEVIPYLNRLNKLHSVCTLQSCAGHSKTIEDLDGSPMSYFENGLLWIWPSEKIAKLFYKHVFKLTELFYIERVSTIYFKEQEVIEVVFNANFREQALEVITVFFETLQEKIINV